MAAGTHNLLDKLLARTIALTDIDAVTQLLLDKWPEHRLHLMEEGAAQYR